MRYRFDSNVVKLITGQCITQILDRALFVSIIWYITQNYSRNELAIFLSFVTIPYLFALYFSSKIINKVGQIRVVFLTDFIRAIFLFSVYLLSNNSYSIIELGLILFFANCLASLFDPAILSLPPLMLTKVNSHKLTALLNTCFSLGAIVGPLFSIKTAHVYGLNNMFLLSSIAYFISGILEFTIKLKKDEINPTTVEGKPKSYWRQFVDINPTVLFFLALGLLINLLFVPLQFFIPVYVQTVLQSNATLYTYLQISMGAGSILGSLFISMFSNLTGKKETIYPLMFYLLSGISYVLFSLSGNFSLSVVSVFIIDFFMSAGNVLALSFYQKVTDNSKLPFIMSCVMFISVSSSPVAMFLAGTMFSWYPLNLVITCYALIASFIIAMAFIISLSMNRVRSEQNIQEALCGR